jgi:hypothetical protein
MPKREVRVVSCPDDFTGTSQVSVKPVSTGKRSHDGGMSSSSSGGDKRAKLSASLKSLKGDVIRNKADFNNMFKSVQSLGSEQFTGYKAKLTKEANYLATVGKPLKRARVPQNILAGMIKKQEKREEKANTLAREAGIITENKKKKGERKSYSEANRRNNNIMGPSPSNGFMKGGILHVKR